MPSILFQLVLSWGMLTQSTSPTPIRTGFATALTEQDLAAINMLLPEKPWLLTGDPGQFSVAQFVEAYLPPTTATPVLRRGTSLFVSRRIEFSTHKPIGEWTVDQPQFRMGAGRRSLEGTSTRFKTIFWISIGRSESLAFLMTQN